MDSACASPVDPIGLVFFGEGITGQNQQEMIQYHTGWGPGGSAGSQYTQRDGPSCDAMVADNSSSCGSCDRFHVRLNYVGSPRYNMLLPWLVFRSRCGIAWWSGRPTKRCGPTIVMQGFSG